jgi:hypothetical protein
MCIMHGVERAVTMVDFEPRGEGSQQMLFYY